MLETTLRTLMVAGALAPLALSVQQEQPEPAATGWLELPEAPLGRMWALVDPAAKPWDPRAAAGSATFDLGEAAAWELWAESLANVRDDGNRRDAAAVLARLALADRRAPDAFQWAALFGAEDPAALAGTLPYVFPGVPVETELGPGGRPPALPDGVHLRPALPPADGPADFDGVVWRSATARGLRIEDTTFDLLVKIDGSGVVLEITNIVGPPVKAVVQVPAPAGHRLRSMYVDWEIQTPPEGEDERTTFDWSQHPIEIELRRLDPKDDQEVYTLFGRIAPMAIKVPRIPDGEVPAVVREGGLELRVDPRDGRPWDAIAEAFGQASGLPFRVARVAPGSRPGSTRGTSFPPTRIGLRASRGAPVDGLRRALTSAMEARVRASLAPDRR